MTSTQQHTAPKILYTSLAEIESFNPCASGWKRILLGQNKSQADNEPIALVDCLKSNTFGDICWLLGKRKVELGIAVRAAQLCADSVKHLNSIYADEATSYANVASYADEADAAADVASYAAACANAAACAAANAAHAAAASAAELSQRERNMHFLLQAIVEYQNGDL